MERRRGAKYKIIALILALVFPAGYLLSQLIVSLIAAFGLAIGAMIGGGTVELSGDLTLVITAVSGILAAVAAVLVIKLRRQKVRFELRLRSPGAGVIAMALVLGVCLNLASLAIMAALPIPQSMVDEYNEQVAEALLGDSNPVLMLLVTGLIVPIVEEIALRGMPMRYLRRAFPGAVAAVIGGSIFALIHGNPLQILYVLPVGIIFCFVFTWTESIIATMAMHIGYNSFSAIINILPFAQEAEASAEDPSLLAAIAMGLVFSAVSAILIALIHRQRVELVPSGNDPDENSSYNGAI